MKQINWLLWIFVIFLAPAANAQVRLGAKTGVNIATVKFNKEAVDPENITGFQIGPMLEVATPTGWGVDVALLYMQKGFELNNKQIKNDYLEVPVNLKWKLMTPLVKPFVAAGPYVGFRVGGKKVWEIDQFYQDIKGQINGKSFSAGLNFSAGAELLSFLQVGLNYGWGLTDNYSTFIASHPDEYVGKAHTWSISAAILF
ncbi:MAG: PorT family protein [Tannerella sp.]|jgi:hypothetical protein|nr:PorT family protein [Tannerella sp.]